MEKILLGFAMVLVALDGFAQGTVYFNNRDFAGTSHIYAPDPHSPYSVRTGNGTNDNPYGITGWGAFPGIGLNGYTGMYGGSDTLAQLLGANGSNQPESSLTPQGATLTFRTGAVAQGLIATTPNPTVTLAGIPLDSPAATFQVAVWDDSTGLYSTWTLASAAWQAGLIAAGESEVFTVTNIGGTYYTPPDTAWPSFNLYFIQIIPEPSTFALVALGAAAMLPIVRRRGRSLVQ